MKIKIHMVIMELVIDPQKAIGMYVSLLINVARLSGEASFIVLFLASHWRISGTQPWETVGVKLPAVEMCTEYFITFFFFNPSCNWDPINFPSTYKYLF